MTNATQAVLSLEGIAKAFGPTRALDGVDLALRSGEVHALVGENGAGKSTLMNVIAGSLRPDEGRVLLDGKPVAIGSASDARTAGIALIHQELSLFPHLTVAENILMGFESARAGWLDANANRERALKVMERFTHPAIRPDRRVGDLPVAAQQIVEICRALAGKTRVLLMDEPTSSLERRDVQRLFELIASLRQEGIAVVYISHFLEEIRTICDRFTVLRDGKSVGSGLVSEYTDDAIVSLMVGRKVDELFPNRAGRTPSRVVLSVNKLSAPPLVQDVSLQLRAGEVLGIAGIVGSGRTETFRALMGLLPSDGTVAVCGQPAETSGFLPARRQSQGLGYLSEDRKREGLALSMSIADNMSLSNFSSLARAGFVDLARQAQSAAALISSLSVRTAGPGQRVGALSGGNQQKVALARLLQQDAAVLLLDEPTKGVDIGSKVHLYQAIDDATRRGKAVLVISSYLPELFGLCDQLAVMCRGRLSETRPTEQWTPETVMAVATGATADKGNAA
jgi:ribose transport system ATP-binding protein